MSDPTITILYDGRKIDVETSDDYASAVEVIEHETGLSALQAHQEGLWDIVYEWEGEVYSRS